MAELQIFPLNQDLEENKEKRKNVSRELAKSEFLNKL
jgi:hypothetical protein